jgi:glyoxylase-like metal-dependent hydrolase (beta-lactamase superfamily II)
MLKKNPAKYTCNVYHIRGNWNAINDVNTLIDVGTDDYILDEIMTLSTGVGKRRVEQIILTHEHFDHAGGRHRLIEFFNPDVIAYSPIPGVTRKAYDGMTIKIGDCEGTILHTPGHSHDSICIYVKEEKILFSGDTLLNIKTPGGTYSREYLDVLERLSRLDIKYIYSGHDDPVIGNASEMIRRTLHNVRASRII